MRVRTLSLQTLFCFMLQFLLLAPPPALARDIRVDDECSLRDAITTYNTKTSTGGCRLPHWGKPRIYLKSDITITEPLPEIRTDLIINGFGHQISGDKLHQIFVVREHTLTLSNLHLVDGFSAKNGGAIHAQNATLTLLNSSIRGSLALESGGAIHAQGGGITITGSIISGNSAESGGAIHAYYASLDLSRSFISDNVAQYGGAIRTGFSSTTVVDSSIENNRATVRGGGIEAADSWLDIQHSSVAGNSAAGRGGGLDLIGVYATIRNVNLSDNFAATDGGAIYWTASTLDFGVGVGRLEIFDSALTGNRALERGGGLFLTVQSARVSNTTFYDNRAGGNGGAVYLEDRPATITHVTIAHNSALNGGGVYTRSPDLLKLRNSLIASNIGGDCVGGLAQNRGNWIADGGCNPQFRGVPNLTHHAGSPLYFPLQRESRAINRAAPEFCPETDQRGTVRPQGDACDIGAFEALDWVDTDYAEPSRTLINSPDIIVDANCSLADAIRSANRDKATGGCVAGYGDDAIRLAADFTATETIPDITSVITIEGEDRSLAYVQFVVRFGDFTVKNLTLHRGWATRRTEHNGGAFYVRYGRLHLNNVSVTESGAYQGGAIYGYDSDIVINESVFANNLAESGAGGALYLERGNVAISNCRFSSNTSESSGGALFASRSTAFQITGCVFNDNTTSGQGGAISSNSSFDLVDSSLQRNLAATGGAVATRAYATVDTENVTFADNRADKCPKIYEEIDRRCD